MIKVHYNSQTNEVMGYYPDSINYKNIPEPYIEITAEEHQNALGKQMVVIDGVLQEFQEDEETQKNNLLQNKIGQAKQEARKRIFIVYPDYVQWNILREEEKISQVYKDMDTFINNYRNKCNEIIDDLQDMNLEQLQAFDVSDDINWVISE